MTEIAGLTLEEGRFVLDTIRRVKAAGILDTTSYLERIKKRLPRNIDDGLGEVRFFKLIGDVRAGTALARLCDKTGTPFDAASAGVRVYELFGYVQNALADYYGLFIKIENKWRFWQGPCIDTSCNVGTSYIDEDSPPAGAVNEAYTHTILFGDLDGDPAASGLPAGLSFNGTTGDITGTPTAAGVYTVIITGTSEVNGCPVTTAFELTIEECDAGTSDIDPDDPPAGTISVAYTHTVILTDLDGDAVAVGLPPGMTFNGTTGALAGTPTAEGTWLVTISGTADTNGCPISAEFFLTIGTCDSENSQLFNLYSVGVSSPDRLPVATINEPYYAAIGFTDIDLPIELINSEYAADFPDGLTFNGSVGTLSGTPTECGEFTIYFRATTTANECDLHLTLTLVINCECPEPTEYGTLGAWLVSSGGATSSSTAYTTIGISSTLPTNNATYNTSPPTVSNLPPGLSWDPVAGEVFGTATTLGTYETIFYGTVDSGTYAGCPIIHTRTYTIETEPPP